MTRNYFITSIIINWPVAHLLATASVGLLQEVIVHLSVLQIKRAGFANPTPIQAQAWPVAMAGRDLVAIAKTGSGKTCGFLLPGMLHINATRKVRPAQHDKPVARMWHWHVVHAYAAVSYPRCP